MIKRVINLLRYTWHGFRLVLRAADSGRSFEEVDADLQALRRRYGLKPWTDR